MSVVKSVLGATVGLQSVALLGRGMSMVPKDFSKPVKSKKMIRGFTDIMVGTALIGPTASMVNSLWI